MRWRNAFILLVLSTVPPSIMTYIGLSHNAMMEFYKNDPEFANGRVIDIEYVITFFSIWFVFSFIVITILFYLIMLVIDKFKS